jgi:hypothetical protein
MENFDLDWAVLHSFRSGKLFFLRCDTAIYYSQSSVVGQSKTKPNCGSLYCGDIMHTTIRLLIFTALFLYIPHIKVTATQLETELVESKTNDSLFRLTDVRTHKIIKQSNSPFAAIIFNENALAIHTCIIYYENMGSPVDGKWDISERTWCNRKWGSDITSLYWCPNGRCLYIGTSLVYGDGGVFRLDLYDKTFTKVYPSKSLSPTGKQGKKYISSSEIIGATKDRLRLEVELSEIIGDEEKELGVEKVTIPLKQKQ